MRNFVDGSPKSAILPAHLGIVEPKLLL